MERGFWLFLVPRSLFLVVIACATAPPPAPAVHWTEVPRAVLDVFCTRLHDEGVSPETTVDVVSTTQKLITPQAMTGLAETGFFDKPVDAYTAAETANRGAAPMPIAVPRGACAWRAVDEKAPRAADVMTIELSSPFANPFARGNAYGLFARISLADESSTWYWVPLAQINGRWAAGTPLLLGIR